MNAIPKKINRLQEFFSLPPDTPAFEKLCRILETGDGDVRVAGIRLPSSAHILSLLAARLPQNLVVVAPNDFRASELADNLTFFSRALGLKREILLFPGLKLQPLQGIKPHMDIRVQRVHTLHRLCTDRPYILVISPETLLLPLPQPDTFKSMCLSIRPGIECPPEKITGHLVSIGYRREDLVEMVASFSVRGFVLDLFSPSQPLPARIEYFDDTIESIREFDPVTQRSVRKLERYEILPTSEFFLTEGPGKEAWQTLALKTWQEKSALQEARAENLGLLSREGYFPGLEYFFSLGGTYPVAELSAFCDRYLPVLLEPAAVSDECRLLHDKCAYAAKQAEENGRLFLRADKILFPPDGALDRLGGRTRLIMHELDVIDAASEKHPSILFSTRSVRNYSGAVHTLAADIGQASKEGKCAVFVMSGKGTAERICDVFSSYDFPCSVCDPSENMNIPSPFTGSQNLTGGITATWGSLTSGCHYPRTGLYIFTEEEVFGQKPVQWKKEKFKHGSFMSDFRDLKVGDYVVHIDHGIGQFTGLKKMTVAREEKEFMIIRYQGDDILYLPLERLNLIQKYSSLEGARPRLDRLGGLAWARVKQRIKKSIRDMAEKLIKLYAMREMCRGHRFPRDTVWQREFETAFEFDPTPGQESSLTDIKADMEHSRPMDRLLCGDVGYGKTEVAMRAAFKAVMDNKQVAVLAPTTVLVFQHYETLKKRFEAFPIKIEMLSRLRTASQARAISREVKEGKVDILVGTHRILSKDVDFKNLGLLVIDEEQRFGVTHKERLRELKTKVDTLTMTATPIPRTLHMALVKARDLSVIETPPKDRLAIQTNVVQFNKNIIASAIRGEIERGGQIYFVHNRIDSIYAMAALLNRIVPEASCCVAHGQMRERDLEKVMLAFVNREYDVLISTSIIENGLDIPLVNTIIINRADKFGLSQLYQLRGRVGRSNRRAYAYLLIPSERGLSDEARKRLSAIQEFSELGSGFRIAGLDLEIRGAGNILGKEQHGHINMIGFDTYCKLMENAIREMRGEEIDEDIFPSLNLGVDIHIPDHYIRDTNQRIVLYRKVSTASTDAELDGIHEEFEDRFGRLTGSLENLLAYARLRIRSGDLRVESIDRKEGTVFIKFYKEPNINMDKVIQFISGAGNGLSPGGVLRFSDRGLKDRELIFHIMETLSSLA